MEVPDYGGIPPRPAINDVNVMDAMCQINGDEVVKIIQVKIDDALVEGIEAYRKRQPGMVPSRVQCIRELIETGIRADLAEVASES